mmetsp:Transcript_9194/g.17542  ORF Transcript_9194/g.17542 Transcript_9194/m.17542 type:complete len:332 (-) Transcript_9194:66-1061(-)
MTILVTGSAGHLGEALVRMLKDEGRDVRGLDIRPSPFTDVVGSIVDPEVCAAAMKDVTGVLHTASLHKPHVATNQRQEFVDTNITGTLNLLEAAVQQRTVSAFIFTSTTSTFGDALKPATPDDPAVWINESTVPKPKNIYGVTKTAAEDLCQLFWKLYKLPCLVLKTSRFFPEEDDTAEIRDFCSSCNAKVNELLFRRADIYDMATAHLQALDRAPALGFDKFVISGSCPFRQKDLVSLHQDAASVVKQYFPEYERIYQRRGWKMFPSIDRAYRNDRAREKLGWTPVYSFADALERLDRGDPLGSDLARLVGRKGYSNGTVDQQAKGTLKS